MKKYYLLFALAIISLSNSCSQKEVYSCDPSINNWVNKHIEEIRTWSRQEWKQLEPSAGRACYVAFSDSQRLSFWLDKFNELMLLDWSENERAHIQRVFSFLEENPDIFKSDFLENEALYDKFDRFMFLWQEYAYKNLSWNKKQINAIIVSGYEVANTDGNLIIGNDLVGADTRASKTKCHCNTEYDFCETHDCKATPLCEYTNFGCGLVMVQSCNGLCTQLEKPGEEELNPGI